MASATGMPEARSDSGRGDEEPLLGRAGDASQQEDQGIQLNFVIGNTQTKLLPQILNTMLKTRSGTAVIAQVGIWIVKHHSYLQPSAVLEANPFPFS